MILDRLKNYKRYNLGPSWSQAFEFLQGLTPKTPDGRYELMGDDLMFAMVMTYEPLEKEASRPEAHKTYIDIQSTISSIEGMFIYDQEELKIETPYDSQKDVEFYSPNRDHEHFISVSPGEFAVFFSSDAHMPQMKTSGQTGPIKKAVVKVHHRLLNLAHHGP